MPNGEFATPPKPKRYHEVPSAPQKIKKNGWSDYKENDPASLQANLVAQAKSQKSKEGDAFRPCNLAIFGLTGVLLMFLLKMSEGTHVYSDMHLEGATTDIVQEHLREMFFHIGEVLLEGDATSAQIAKMLGVSPKLIWALLTIMVKRKTARKEKGNPLYERAPGNTQTKPPTPRKPSKLPKQVAKLKDLLDTLGISYIMEHTFSKTGRKRFDFYLPDYNLVIEIDGRQHFEVVLFFGGEEGFRKRQESDKFKDKQLKKMKISLLRIAYTRNGTAEMKGALKTALKMAETNPGGATYFGSPYKKKQNRGKKREHDNSLDESPLLKKRRT